MLRPADFRHFTGRRAHLGFSGSVACLKAASLVRELTGAGASVGATLTRAASRFVTPLSLEALGAAPVYGAMYPEAGDPPAPDIYGHLEPAQNADCLVIAPATANVLAKLAHGLADDMLSAQALAFGGPVVAAPAMNPRMWDAPATRENVAKLASRGVILVGPVAGGVACGEEGAGRMAEVEAIVWTVLRAMASRDLDGTRVLLTMGPTREWFDPVRFWSNPSSGTMGAALAVSAWLRGARVTAVCGPGCPQLPDGIDRVDVETARDMHKAATDLWPEADVGVCSAAVADFRPRPHAGGKLKKAGRSELELTLEANPDVLASLGGSRREGQKLVGFAAESGDPAAGARDKLQRKGCDMVVGNAVCAFGSADNAVVLVDGHGRVEQWPSLPKTEVAWRIWDHVSLL